MCRVLGWACGRTQGCPWGSQPDGDPREPHTGPPRFLLCLQSSGNVWVTHEEMETLAKSTKTVSLALSPGPGIRADDLHKMGRRRGLQLLSYEIGIPAV